MVIIFLRMQSIIKPRFSLNEALLFNYKDKKKDKKAATE